MRRGHRPELDVLEQMLEAGLYKEALTRTEAALTANPHDQELLLLCIRAHGYLGNERESIPLWIGLARQNPRSVIRSIRMLVRQGKYEMAAYAFSGLEAGRGGSDEIIIEKSWLVGALFGLANQVATSASEAEVKRYLSSVVVIDKKLTTAFEAVLKGVKLA